MRTRVKVSGDVDAAVVVVKGRYRGSIGFIDDWSLEGNRLCAVVYLNGETIVLADPYVVLPASALRLATEEEAHARDVLELTRIAYRGHEA